MFSPTQFTGMQKYAWSGDGYLDRQDYLYDIPYGNYTLEKKGCGFIAAFNALKAADRNPDFDTVYNWFNKYLIGKGKWGTTDIQLIYYLIKQRLFKGMLFCSPKKYKNVEIGIMLYKVDKHSNHYAAFYKDGEKFRFINADAFYSTVKRYTMEEFIKKHAYNGKHYYVIKIK